MARVTGQHLSTGETGFVEARLLFDGDVTGTGFSVTYNASSLDAEGRVWLTTLTFERPLHVAFHDSELGLPMGNPDQLDFGLTEIEQSSLIEEFRSTKSLENTAKPILGIGGLKHYRFYVDEHGGYDVICTGLAVEGCLSAENWDPEEL